MNLSNILHIKYILSAIAIINIIIFTISFFSLNRKVFFSEGDKAGRIIKTLLITGYMALFSGIYVVANYF